MRDDVRKYYARFDEWARLESPAGRLELRCTLALFDRHVPAPCRVLDLGGGPGRQALELARRGHRVTLADLSPVLLDEARRRAAAAEVELDAIDEVDAVDLGRYAEASFDAALVLGPFYHLVERADRERAARELRRVLAPAAVALVAYLPRAAGLAGLVERAASRPEQVPAEVLRAALETGVFRNATDSGFQDGWYPRTAELEELFVAADFDVLEAVSLLSVADRIADSLEALGPETRAVADELLDGLSRERGVVDVCGHAVLVCRAV